MAVVSFAILLLLLLRIFFILTIFVKSLVVVAWIGHPIVGTVPTSKHNLFSSRPPWTTISIPRGGYSQKKRNEQYHLLSHWKDSSDDDTNKQTQPEELQKALFQSTERSLDHFMSTEAPTWLFHQSSSSTTGNNTIVPSGLPFSCTGCGKCCRTEGDVYLEPADIRKAASYFHTSSLLQFVEEYASHYMVMTTATATATSSSLSSQPQKSLDDLLHENRVWIRLKGGSKSNACIFLDDETNQCQIYEARPVQCRSYPFWPNIIQTPELWNAECRRMGDEEEEHKNHPVQNNETLEDMPLPFWSPERGGCEGMSLLGSSKNDAQLDDKTMVPIREACRQLMEYTLADQRFPQSAPEIPIESSL